MLFLIVNGVKENKAPKEKSAKKKKRNEKKEEIPQGMTSEATPKTLIISLNVKKLLWREKSHTQQLKVCTNMSGV